MHIFEQFLGANSNESPLMLRQRVGMPSTPHMLSHCTVYWPKEAFVHTFVPIIIL